MKDLEKLSACNVKIDAVNKRLDALGHMLVDTSALKHLKPKYAGFIYDDSIDVTTIFQNDNVTITLGIWHKAGMEYPPHCHSESLEYIICTSGSFKVFYNQNITVLKKGDYLQIPRGCIHSNISLEDESSMFGICIPPEKAYVQCEEKAE